MTQQQPQQYGGIGQRETGGQQHGAGPQGSQFQGSRQSGMRGGQQSPFQGGQQSQFGGGQGGQQPQFQGGGGQQPMDVKLEEGLTDEMRVALHDFVQSTTVCEWCAERCIDEGPEMAECIRLCRDVADLASLNVQLISRDSVFGPEAAQVFAEAAEACAQECARHGHRHCQECAEVLSRAARSTRKMLASFEGPGGAQGGQRPQSGGGQGGQQSQFGGGQGGQQSQPGGQVSQQPQFGGGQATQQPGETGYERGGQSGGGTGSAQSQPGQGY